MGSGQGVQEGRLSSSIVSAENSALRRGSAPWPLLLILLGAGALRLAFSSSLSGNDDLAIAGCSLGLLDGSAAMEGSHYCARLGMTLPLAGIFAVAGTGVGQLSVLPALSSVASTLLAWRLGSLLFGALPGYAAAAALALFPMDVGFAGLAFPDVMQGALVSAAMLFALLTRGAPPRAGWAMAIISGALWAWAYYVKLDAFMLAPILLVATLMGLMRWQHMIVVGVVALILVGVELIGNGVWFGDPLRHLHLDSAATNEALAAGRDYRDLFTYPKTMFIVPYNAGIHYFLWVIALVVAVRRRCRPALFVCAWCLIWQVWLTFGADPLSGFRLKPQLGRYLMSWEVPMAVLVGWVWTWIWRRMRLPAIAIGVAAAAAIAVLGPFNQLSYKAALATRLSVSAAVENNWFPLYPDVQSLPLARFLLRGRPEAALLRVVQRHDFLRGVTTFEPIAQAPAFLLINESYARQLEARNLVRPIDPASFGLKPTQVFEVDRPMSALSYMALDLLATGARIIPGATGAHIRETVADVLRPGDARIWRLD